MTLLRKAIARRTELDPKLGRREAGQVTVTLYPEHQDAPTMIGFRKLKRRHEVRLSLDAVYSLALKNEAKVLAIEKRRLRQLRRA